MTDTKAWTLGIPGTLCSPAIFDPFAAALARSMPAERFHGASWMTGQGPWDIASIAASIAADIDRQQVGPVLIVGHSTGGAIALSLAITQPRLVRGLVLVNTGPHMRDHGDVDSVLTAVRDRWGEELRESILLRSFATAPPVGAMEELHRFARSCEQRAVLDVLTSQREHDFEPYLADIGCPVTVVHGVRDPVRTTEQARLFATQIPGASLTLLDCGHSPPMEAPTQLATAVRDLAARAAK